MKNIDTKITQNWLDEHSACRDGVNWLKVKTGIGAKAGDILRDLQSENEWSYFNWLAARVMNQTQRVRWAIFAAEQVIDIFEKKYPNDNRPRKAIEAANKWVENPTEKNKNAAADAAYAAYAAAYAAYAAAYAAAAYAAYAAYAADAAANAADAAYAAAAYAAYAAAANAADAAAADAAYAAAAAAARNPLRNKLADKAYEILSEPTGEQK